MRIDIARIAPERFAIRIDGGIRQLNIDVGIAHVVVQLRPVEAECLRLLVVLEGLVRVVLQPLAQAEIVVCVGIIRTQLDGLLERFGRGFELFKLEVDAAKRHPRGRVVRVGGDALLENRAALLMASGLRVCKRKVPLCICIARVQPNGLGIARDRIVNKACPQ